MGGKIYSGDSGRPIDVIIIDIGKKAIIACFKAKQYIESKTAKHDGATIPWFARRVNSGGWKIQQKRLVFVKSLFKFSYFACRIFTGIYLT